MQGQSVKIVGVRCKVVFLLLFFVVLLYKTSRVALSSCSSMIIRARGTTGETGPGMRARGNHLRRDMCLFRDPERRTLGRGSFSREGYIGFKFQRCQGIVAGGPRELGGLLLWPTETKARGGQ